MGDAQKQAADTTMAERPEGYTQDDGNGNVWWGEPVRGAGYRIHPVWTVGEGHAAHVDVDDSLTAAQLHEFIQNLQRVEGTISN